MHELGITQTMFDIVLKQAQARRVTRINVVIGELTGVVGDSVQFYLQLLGKGTVAEGAELKVTSVPPSAKCLGCGIASGLKPFDFTCPACGGSRLEITAGKELFVESIEVEDGN